MASVAVRTRLLLGYRGTALLFFALVWTTVGLGVLDNPRAIDATHALPLEYLPLWFRAGLWFTAAACALTAAFWPPGNDKWGWAVLCIPIGLRIGSYVIAAIMGWYDVRYAVAWLTILGLVVLLAAWPEPAKPEPDVKRSDPRSYR
jgi:hypothetical protein